MWYVLRGWSPLRGMRRTAQARALRVSAGADALCCMGWTPILPAILCLSRLRRSSVLRLWLRSRGARAKHGYPTSWTHLRDKSLRFGLRLRPERAHLLAFGSSPPVVVARTGVAALRSAHGLRPHHRPVAWAPFRPAGLIPMAAPPSSSCCPGGLPEEETAARRMRFIASQFAPPLPCPMPIFVGGRFAPLQKFGTAPYLSLCAAHNFSRSCRVYVLPHVKS